MCVRESVSAFTVLYPGVFTRCSEYAAQPPSHPHVGVSTTQVQEPPRDDEAQAEALVAAAVRRT